MIDTALLFSEFDAAFSAAGFDARKRSVNRYVWRDVCDRADFTPVDYCNDMIDYQLAYWSGEGREVQDLSVVLMQDKQPLAIWPLSATPIDEGRFKIGSNGGSLLPPLFVAGLSKKSEKRIVGACAELLDVASRRLRQYKYDFVEGFRGCAGISLWHDLLMSRGGATSLSYDLFIDLSASMAEIKGGFRKSYRSIVTSGAKHWRPVLASKPAPALWDEFMHLHFEVAGRRTRSQSSWQSQHDAITSGSAFFIGLRDASDRLVGGGLFHVTRTEGLYAVAAYDRALFDKPLGHVVQYLAIEEMKRRGVHWYRLGARAYPSDKPKPTAKELDISEFKQGFASHLFPRYRIEYEIAS